LAALAIIVSAAAFTSSYFLTLSSRLSFGWAK
jgi:hypothetical protein